MVLDRHSNNNCWTTGSTLFPLLGKLSPGPKPYSLSMWQIHPSRLPLSHPPAPRAGLNTLSLAHPQHLIHGDHTQTPVRTGGTTDNYADTTGVTDCPGQAWTHGHSDLPPFSRQFSLFSSYLLTGLFPTLGCESLGMNNFCIPNTSHIL